MAAITQIEDFLSFRNESILLDIRSPTEYKSGHIPGAVSLPLFNDEERAIVGTSYKVDGKKTAVKKGLDIVGPKLKLFVEKVEEMAEEKVALYCWRGGMRSQSMSWLLEQAGFKTTLLEGGYKSYRNHLLNYFKRKLPLHVISGYTGSKKTDLLKLLKKKGEQVIDLEGLAQHQGSRFGNIMSNQQPTTEQFQNLIFEQFVDMSMQRPIWIEDESITIGRVCLVEDLYIQKNKSPHFVIEIDKAERVEFLVEEYGSLNDEELIKATLSIGKKLGLQNMNAAIQNIKSGNMYLAAELILTYYDRQYRKALDRKRDCIQDTFRIKSTELESLASQLIKKSLHEL